MHRGADTVSYEDSYGDTFVFNAVQKHSVAESRDGYSELYFKLTPMMTVWSHIQALNPSKRAELGKREAKTRRKTSTLTELLMKITNGAPENKAIIQCMHIPTSKIKMVILQTDQRLKSQKELTQSSTEFQILKPKIQYSEPSAHEKSQWQIMSQMLYSCFFEKSINPNWRLKKHRLHN